MRMTPVTLVEISRLGDLDTRSTERALALVPDMQGQPGKGNAWSINPLSELDVSATQKPGGGADLGPARTNQISERY